ncbi:hypothetical protein [Marivirga tractuosa]|nr:hypothetical protein [Marivirga tractuosa]
MPTFSIVYKDDTTQDFEADSKESLIRDFSINDATAFQNDVKEIHWKDHQHQFVEEISSGKVIKRPIVIEK